MKAWKKALICGVGVGVGAAGVIVARNIMTKRLTELAIVRADPQKIAKSKSRVSGSRKNHEQYEKIRAAAHALEAREHETVEIASHDGTRLVGHYFKAPREKRIVIAMHGWRSKWCYDFSGLCELLDKCDCSVLYPEQRGQNASGGDYMGFGVVERHDCLAWAKYIAEREGADVPIYLFGISMGGTTVMMCADLDLPRNVKGIISDCGYTSPKEIWRHVVNKNLHVPYGFISGKVDMAYKKYTNLECNFSAADALSRASVPVLFIHGSDDKFVPVDMAYRNFKACKSDKELLIVPSAGHGQSYTVDRDKYECKVREFFEKNDK